MADNSSPVPLGLACFLESVFFSDAEGLMPKKLEEIAYQASDKVYSKEDTGPYECLR